MAYQDRNSNGEVDLMELQGEQQARLTGPDTVFLDIPVLQPDTTPAQLVGAQALDSVTVMMEFDDPLDPTEPLRMRVRLVREEVDGPGVGEFFHEHEYVEWLQAVQDSFARLDSLDMLEMAQAAEAADSLGVTEDTVRAAADTAGGQTVRPERQERRLPPGLPAARGGAPGPILVRPGEEPDTPDGNPLPSRRVVVRLEAPLEPNAPYQLIVVGVINIHRMPLGGGEAALVLEPPVDSAALADTLAADTVVADTASVPPDTGSLVLPQLRPGAGIHR